MVHFFVFTIAGAVPTSTMDIFCLHYASVHFAPVLGYVYHYVHQLLLRQQDLWLCLFFSFFFLAYFLVLLVVVQANCFLQQMSSPQRRSSRRPSLSSGAGSPPLYNNSSFSSFSPSKYDDDETPTPPNNIYTAPIPSYLAVKPGCLEESSSAAAQKIAVEEADVAGGRSGGSNSGATQSVLRRVSSFSIMSRLPSQNQLSSLTLKETNSNSSSSSTIHNQNPATPTLPADRRSSSMAEEGNEDSSFLFAAQNDNHKLKPNWRLTDRMKTVGVGLVMALNVGTDPPDITKPHPCAKLQCWMDPSSVTRAKAKEKIGERLEAQYVRWQQQRAARPLKYRRALDPTVEDVRALCMWLRRQARHERILFHYNGHGVPRPTPNGEIWVFDKDHTEYIPLSVSDLRQWMGKPTIVILDCSSAGILIPFLTSPVTETPPNTPPRQPQPVRENNDTTARPFFDMDAAASHWVKDTIVLCPTSAEEWLPMHPEYPADIFTSCLTTPIQMALRWFVRRNKHSMGSLNPEAVDAIPGQANDRKTPLGELNWVFTSVTDSIAWKVLPKPLFQRLFRQDLLVASMFRNFLLADRILRSLNCTPQSYPPLPPGVADHPLWQAWDLACETCLFGLMQDGILGNHVVKPTVPRRSSNGPTHNNNNNNSDSNVNSQDGDCSGMGSSNGTSSIADTPPPPPVPTPKPQDPTPQTGPASSVSSPFFSEQLQAFEVWLEYASIHKDQIAELESPEQLPVVLQVLLSQVHRIRALELLRRFLALGPWAVNLSLSLGIFPYVMKLLTSVEYKSVLVDIWASILKFDPSCQVDLVKDRAVPHFILPLTSWSEQSPIESAKQRTYAAFALAATCHKYPQGQAECLRQNLHGHCRELLSTYAKLKLQIDEQGYESLRSQLMSPKNREWICVCLGNMALAFPPAQHEIFNTNTHNSLFSRLDDDAANVRAAASFALGCLLEYVPDMRPQAPPPIHLGPQGLAPATFQPSPGAQSFQGQQVLVPQQMSATTVTVPAAMTASAVLSGRLQPPLGNPTLAGNQAPNSSMWHPSQGQPLPGIQPQGQLSLAPQGSHQPMGRAQQQQQLVLDQRSLGGPLQASRQPPPINRVTAPTQGLHLGGQPLQAGASFMPQQNILRPTGLVGNMMPTGMMGSPIMGTPFGASMGASQSLFMSPIPAPVEQQQPRRRPAVYEDRRRTELDLTVAEALCNVLGDGSSLVRYEAMMALCNFVEKYFKGFLVVAEEATPRALEEADTSSHRSVIPIPQGFSRPTLGRFAACWERLKTSQQEETHPNVGQLADTIVCAVHEQLFDLTMERDFEVTREEKKGGLSGIDEEGVGGEMERSKAGLRLKSLAQLKKPRRERTSSEGLPHRSPDPTSYSHRRVSSGNVVPQGDLLHSPPADDVFKRFKREYSFPKSKHYAWMVKIFDSNVDDTEDQDFEDLDPLNPVGAVRAYQGRRNATLRENVRKLGERFERLKPKPRKKQGLNLMLEISDEEADEADSSLKVELKLRETRLLRNTGGKMTSMLKFHSYEDVLMICDQDSISFWDYENGVRSLSYKNGNPQGSRMTTAFWINESSRSLCFVGCDDGSARIWDGTLETNGQVSTHSPTLSSAFSAVPDMEAGQRGSGLICEWYVSQSCKLFSCFGIFLTLCCDSFRQPHSSTLIAGGNSRYIRCWDLASEKCTTTLSTDTDACVTTLCTAWDYDLDISSGGAAGMGPDIVVAGHSDGSLKVFDIRSPNGALQVSGRRSRKSRYAEHQNWIVDASFACYGGKPEIISGSVDGDIRAWDLRMSSSLRVLEVQRSPMTALAVHKQIPIAATGSHAQFIKILTLEGETLQVARHHEDSPRHRIGPVSCLEFHKHKLVLATGTTDSLVSIYKPKHPRSF